MLLVDLDLGEIGVVRQVQNEPGAKLRFDIEAANRAGMTSVLYLQENNRDYAGDADLVFSHFDELATWLPPLAR